MALANLSTAQLAALDAVLSKSTDRLVAMAWRFLRAKPPADAPAEGIADLADYLSESRDAAARAAWADAMSVALPQPLRK